MDRQQWLDERDSRSLRYSGRRLDPARWILIDGDPTYLRSYEGQVAALVASNLLGRMTPSVALSLPDLQLSPPLPWAGQSLTETILERMYAADPDGQFCRRSPRDSDVRLHIGPNGFGQIIHGLGWNGYVGRTPSPLKLSSGPNPFGAALAAVVAVARVFAHDLNPPQASFLFNALTWEGRAAPANAQIPTLGNIGDLWFAGVGSVGSAALYFLTLATRDFSAALFDMDVVKVHNLDRSPMFTAENAANGDNKVHAAERYLLSTGVRAITSDACALHESLSWIHRRPGRPDVLISAANELNVRNFIEEAFPPLQIYATTGKNWQTALVRHVPLKDPCSLCLFPNIGPQPPTQCATASVPANEKGDGRTMDAALPFLSFLAGLMVAAELTKLGHSDYPYSANRIFFQTLPEPTLVPTWMSHRPGCMCGTRSPTVHRRMLAGGRYRSLGDC